MVYQILEINRANNEIMEAKVNLAEAKVTNNDLKMSLSRTSDHVGELLDTLEKTQKEVRQISQDVPKVVVDRRGNLKVELAVEPDAAATRDKSPTQKAAINIDSGRIQY
jgi:hypothetical protein